MTFDWALLRPFSAALATTSLLSVAAALGAMAWGALLFFATLGLGRSGRIAVDVYVQLFRNIPVLLPIYLVYFGLPMLGLFWTAGVCGVLALMLQQGAYVSEILRSSATAVDQTQHDAALSIGLSRWKQFSKVVLPQVLVHALPALGNQAVLLLKDTSLLSAITVTDLLMQARLLVESAGATYTPFVIATILYLVLVLIVDLGFGLTLRRVRWR